MHPVLRSFFSIPSRLLTETQSGWLMIKLLTKQEIPAMISHADQKVLLAISQKWSFNVQLPYLALLL